MEIKPELISALVDGEVPKPWDEKLLARIKADPKASLVYQDYLRASSLMADDAEKLEQKAENRKEDFYASLMESIQVQKGEAAASRTGQRGLSRLFTGVLRIPAPAAIAATFVIFFGVATFVASLTDREQGPPSLAQSQMTVASPVSNPSVQTLYSTQLDGLQITAEQEALLRSLLSTPAGSEQSDGQGIGITVNLADVDQLLQLLQGASQIRELTIDIPAGAAGFEIYGEPALSRAGSGE